MQSVTSNAVASALGDYAKLTDLAYRLRTVSMGNPRQFMGNVSNCNEYEFINKIKDYYGSAPVLIYFGYGWANNLLIKCYQGGTNVANLDANGNGFMFIFGGNKIGSGSWNATTYLLCSGFNSSGSGANKMVLGVVTYNGGTSIVRSCRAF